MRFGGSARGVLFGVRRFGRMYFERRRFGGVLFGLRRFGRVYFERRRFGDVLFDRWRFRGVLFARRRFGGWPRWQFRGVLFGGRRFRSLLSGRLQFERVLFTRQLCGSFDSGQGDRSLDLEHARWSDRAESAGGLDERREQ